MYLTPTANGSRLGGGFLRYMVISHDETRVWFDQTLMGPRGSSLPRSRPLYEYGLELATVLSVAVPLSDKG